MRPRSVTSLHLDLAAALPVAPRACECRYGTRHNVLVGLEKLAAQKVLAEARRRRLEVSDRELSLLQKIFFHWTSIILLKISARIKTRTHQCAPPSADGPTYPTVSLQGLHEVVVGLRVKVEPVLVHVLEVQVLVGGGGFLPLLPRRPSLVGGSLQVVLVVHFDRAWQDVVHDHQPDVDAS